MNDVTQSLYAIPGKWLHELLALCGPEDHELRERIRAALAAAPQAAPAAPAAVPDEREASIRYDVLHEFATKHRVDYNELCTTARAALAATPEVQTEPVAAGEYLQLPMQVACSGLFPVYSEEQMRAYADAHRNTTVKAEPVVPKWIDDPHDIEQGQMLNPEWIKAHEVASAPAQAEPVSDEPPFLLRLRVEQRELQERYEKLEAFLTTLAFSMLDNDDADLLVKQSIQQHSLLQTLNQRIHNATEKHLRSKNHE